MAVLFVLHSLFGPFHSTSWGWHLLNPASYFSPERRLVEVTFAHPGERYLARVDNAFMRSAFETPSERGRALARLLDAINPRLVEAGHVRQLRVSTSDAKLLDMAERRYHQQMARAGLGEFGGSDLQEARQGDPTSEAMVMGLIVSEPAEADELTTGGERAAWSFLKRQGTRTQDPEVLFVYYGPDPGDTLSDSEASGIARRLANTAAP